MNEYKKMFRDARRLRPSPELWFRIAAWSRLSAASLERSARVKTPLRAAAALTLAAGLAGLLFQQTRHRPVTPVAVAATEVVDPDLLAWQAGLGEVNWESDEGYPFADRSSSDLWSGESGEEGESL